MVIAAAWLASAASALCAEPSAQTTEPASASTETPSGPLDGTAWTVRVAPDEDAASHGEKTFTDRFVFERGTVTMTECVKAGFAPSSYRAWQVSGGIWSFTADQASAREGTTAWTGAILEQDIKGTLLWTKPAGTVFRYSYEGHRAARPR